MNFFDSLFEKIPILRDIDKKKRKMAAIFFVFVIISILGIIIDAIAEAGGAIALTAVAVGFLLMAVIIVADYVMSKKTPQEPLRNDEQYSFFDDSPGDTAYQDEAYDYYNANDGPQNDAYGNDEIYENDYQEDFTDDNTRFDDYNSQDDYQPQEIEYAIEPEVPREDTSTMRFGGVFHRGQSNESTAISVGINGYSSDPRDNYEPARSSFEFMHEESPNLGGDYVGQPVMNFTNPSDVRDEITMTANAVAPNIAPPPPKPDLIGGPVMSIPSRTGGYAPIAAEPIQPVQPVQQPAMSYTPPQTPVYTKYRQEPQYQPAYQQQSGRGKEIEEFFDNMSEDELLYSDCVEVWAADAKPAAIRLLKQVESLSDKKMADSLGREAEYINAMLDRIYYFTMLDSIRDNLELKKYNFSAVVKECLRRFSPFFMEKRIGLLWKGLDIDIITDKRWLIFALTQIVFNAVEFTGLGGKIAISAKKEGSLIHLMVDDNGCGISDEDLPHIFMAGFMGDNVPNESGRRTGMGLFIARSVVEKLGGTITVESTITKGTRITIILPEKP